MGRNNLVANPGSVATFEAQRDSPESDDVRSLLEPHLAFANEHSPPEDVHALDMDGLLADDVPFFSIREDSTLLGVGALKQLDQGHLGLKSIHT